MKLECFWNHVKVSRPNDCWLWQQALNEHGYGRPFIGSRREYAHRVAYSITNNVAVKKGDVILHVCDTPACCNPKHLRLGTMADNTNDMMIKRRCRHVLSKENVEYIRANPDNMTQRKLAARFNVSQGTIGFASRGETWIERSY